jgi:hypothetical protein
MIKKLNLYKKKKAELYDIAVQEGDKEMMNDIQSLSLDEPNILWNLLDTTFVNKNDLLMYEIALAASAKRRQIDEHINSFENGCFQKNID